jgi:hypothetical protein
MIRAGDSGQEIPGQEIQDRRFRRFRTDEITPETPDALMMWGNFVCPESSCPESSQTRSYMSVEMDSATKRRVEIYVRLLEEGTDVSRLTQALDLGCGLFRLEATTNYDPEAETWEFVPGS